METSHRSTRAINSGSGNRALVPQVLVITYLSYVVLWQIQHCKKMQQIKNFKGASAPIDPGYAYGPHVVSNTQATVWRYL